MKLYYIELISKRRVVVIRCDDPDKAFDFSRSLGYNSNNSKFIGVNVATSTRHKEGS